MSNKSPFTEEEMKYVEQLIGALREGKGSKSTSERMRDYCLARFPEMTRETADGIVNTITSTVATFGDGLKNEDTKTWFYNRLDEATEGMTREEVYAYYLSALIAIKSLDAREVAANLEKEDFDGEAYYQELKEMSMGLNEEELTDEDLEELLTQLEDAMGHSAVNIMLNSEIISLLENMSEEQTQEFVEGNASDAEFKCFATLALYLGKEEGKITSIGKDATLESLAVGVCARIEGERTARRAIWGEITWEEAMEKLEKIAKVATACLVIGGAVVAAGALMAGSGALLCALFGGSLLALFIGAAGGGVAAEKFFKWSMSKVGDASEAVGGGSKAAAQSIKDGCEFVKKYTQETLIPAVKKGAEDAWAFIEDLVAKGIAVAMSGVEKLKEMARV